MLVLDLSLPELIISYPDALPSFTFMRLLTWLTRRNGSMRAHIDILKCSPAARAFDARAFSPPSDFLYF